MYYRSIVNIHNVVYAIHQMKSSIVSSVWLSIFTCIFVITPVLLLHTKLVLIKRTFQKMLRTRGNQFYYDILHDGECRAISFHQTHASSLIGRWLRVQYRSIQPNIKADPNLTQGLLPESTRNLLVTNLSATCGFYFKINSGLTLDFFGVSFLGSL